MFKMVNMKLKGKQQRSKKSRNQDNLDELMESFKYINNVEVDKYGI